MASVVLRARLRFPGQEGGVRSQADAVGILQVLEERCLGLDLGNREQGLCGK